MLPTGQLKPCPALPPWQPGSWDLLVEAESCREHRVPLGGTITGAFDQSELSYPAPNHTRGIRPHSGVIVSQLRRARNVRYPVILIMDALSLHVFFRREAIQISNLVVEINYEFNLYVH